MKKIAGILLFVFVAFLTTPTIICAIEEDADISVVYSFSEEEQVHKSFKLAFYLDQLYNKLYFFSRDSKTILSKNSLKHDEVSLGIFIPPPELI